MNKVYISQPILERNDDGKPEFKGCYVTRQNSIPSIPTEKDFYTIEDISELERENRRLKKWVENMANNVADLEDRLSKSRRPLLDADTIGTLTFFGVIIFAVIFSFILAIFG